MVGEWIIDGVDIYSQYNVGVMANGFDELLTFPDMKIPQQNDWHEYDGIEVDLSAPRINNKTLTVQFASVTKHNANIENFLAFIAKPGYRLVRINSMERLWVLRVTGEANRSVYKNGEIFTIQFADDFPLFLIEENKYVWGTEDSRIIKSEDGQHAILVNPDEADPSGHGMNAPVQEYSIDGVSLNDYGVCVLEGTKASILKMPDLKENLFKASQFRNGISYDADFVRFKAKEVIMKCEFYNNGVARFWNNYCSFFNALIQPAERKLYVEYMNDEFSFHYKSTGNFDFHRHKDIIACKFDLTLVFTDFRPKTNIYVWGSEGNRVIKTENNINAIKK